MFYHFLLVGWRNLQRYRVSAGIGVVGLSMGLVCFVFCSYCARLYFGTDKSFLNYKRLAEVELKVVGEGEEPDDFLLGTPPTLAEILKDDFSGQVECFTVFSSPGDMNATFEKPDGKKVTYNLNTIEVDRNFKTVFSCRLREGNWEQIFRQRNAVVLSRSVARRLFGDQSPLGAVFHPNSFTYRTTGVYTPEDMAAIDYTVVGVMEDLPLNTSFSLLVPVDALFINDEYGYFVGYTPGRGRGAHTFALLHPRVDRAMVNRKIDPEKYRIEITETEAVPVFVSPGKHYMEYYRRMGYAYWGVGLLILLVAGLNFFTFIAGNFLNRVREYNVRKGIGGSDRQLFGLLFTETLLLLIPVGIVVACLVELLYAHLDFSMTKRTIVFQSAELYVQLLEYMGMGIVACAAVCWGIGRYLSRKYMRVGIGNGMRGAGKQKVRNVMLGIQLVISLLFFTGGLAIYLQLEVLAGNIFPSLPEEEKERILEVQLTYPQTKDLEMPYVERMKQIPGVADVLLVDHNLLMIDGYMSVGIEGDQEVQMMKVSKNFAAFLNLPLLAGEVFQHPGQVVGDRKVDALFGGNSVGRSLEDRKGLTFNVCGVVEDFPEIYTVRHRMKVWGMSEKPAWCYLKVYPGARERVSEEVRKMLGEVVPETMDLRIPSLAETIRAERQQEEKTKSLLLFFTVVCLAITILGVYSAIRIDSEKRQKEIAVRKINGASSFRIAGLFLRLYLKLLLIATILVFPLLWWMIREWLASFTVQFYHGIWFWISVILAMAVVIALTIAWKIRQIIRTDPVKVLRSE